MNDMVVEMLAGLEELTRAVYRTGRRAPVVVKPLGDVPFIPLPDGRELIWDAHNGVCDVWRDDRPVEFGLTSEQAHALLMKEAA